MNPEGKHESDYGKSKFTRLNLADNFDDEEKIPDGSPQEKPHAEVTERYFERNLPGGEVERVHVSEHIPSEVRDIDTIMAPGFAETSVIAGEFATELAQAGGTRVKVVDQPRTNTHPVDLPPGEWSEGYAPVHLDRGARLLGVGKDGGSAQFDMIGHSEGCIDVVAAALQDVESGGYSVRNIILVNPGGLVIPEDDGAAKLAVHAGVEALAMALSAAKHPDRWASTLRNTMEALRYMKANPSLGLEEIQSIAATVITDSLAELQTAGIGVVMAAGVDDHIFTMKRVQESMTGHGKEINGFISMKGGHNSISENPKTVGRAIASVRTSLAHRFDKPAVANGRPAAEGALAEQDQAA